jgi:Asp-tRNA(Asn)/Glu-tRNA(Gln) amidotransferase A subunit family amidase
MNETLLTATEILSAIRDGRITPPKMARLCLDIIEVTEEAVGAWASLDPDGVRAQADILEAHRQKGLALGPLHGVPVGIKDIIDTSDMPTELGTPLHAGRRPSADATVVSLLREAGAIIPGKTVTTELAVLAPGKTRNPHNPKHTPGGSSSGSAAAVAAGMVPLAVGSQTNGSIIRPASFCGVFGFKPTHGRISRHGVLAQSRPLDTLGVFARTLEDLALISDVLMVYDDRDPDMRPIPRPRISKIMAEEPPGDPHLAFVRSAVWGQAEESTKDALRELIDSLNEKRSDSVVILDLPPMFNDALEVHRTIMERDLAKSFAGEYATGKDKLSAILVEMIERGREVTDGAYDAAIGRISELNDEIYEITAEYDAILTPATAGEAPAGLETTGSPAFCTIWTLCGTPALNLPVFQGPSGLPIGVQLVADRDDDARLFRTASWLMRQLEE